MGGMFATCTRLTTIGDTSNWNTAACKVMSDMFASCENLETIGDTSNWNTSACTTMKGMFSHCISLDVLDVSNWDVSNVTTFNHMFSSGNYGNSPMIIKELDVSKWNTSSATDMAFMFYGCKGPKTLDVSSWDVSKVTNFDHMFAHSNLTLTGVDNWAPSTACTNMNAMFLSIQNTSIDVSKFNTSKVQFFSQMFQGANKLTEIIGLENFNTSAGLGFEEMFLSCSSLKELDLSSFDTTKAKDGVLGSTNGHTTATMQNMFTGMQRLEKITLGEKFTFQGDGTTTEPSHYAVLPTPADGYWYNTNGTAYAPADVPSLTADTYYASYALSITGSMPKQAHFLDKAGLKYLWYKITSALYKKVDKVDGKGLSSNDFTDEYKARVDSALQSYTETDPTVPAWAKAATKPTYTAEEVGALAADTHIPSIAGLASEDYVTTQVAQKSQVQIITWEDDD